MKKLFLFFYLSVVGIAAFAAEPFVVFTATGNHFPLVANGVPCPIYIDSSEDKGVMIAAGNLQQDILQVWYLRTFRTDGSISLVLVGRCSRHETTQRIY